MLPTSHLVPIDAAGSAVAADPRSLVDAFSEFIAASGRLERSYQELQQEVLRLRRELQDRNTALQSSVAENERMRLALQRIVSALPCGVLVFDASRSVNLMNPEAMRLLDLESARSRCTDESIKIELPEFVELASASDSEQEFCISTANGKRWIALRSRQLFSGDPSQLSPQSCQTIVTLRDISAQKDLETEREAARNTIALAEMATVLAHEIRNPLASLELFVGLMQDERASVKEYVGYLQAGIRTLSATVNNVLRFNSRGISHLSPMNLTDAVRLSADFLRPIATQSSVEIVLQGDAPVWITADQNEMQQVMLNLGTNAVRHMPGGGQLTISVERVDSEDRARITVADTGVGIAPEHLPRIFNAGFSGSGHTPGLGLAVCRRIVEQHGGTISVASERNRGCIFTMEFPIYERHD